MMDYLTTENNCPCCDKGGLVKAKRLAGQRSLRCESCQLFFIDHSDPATDADKQRQDFHELLIDIRASSRIEMEVPAGDINKHYQHTNTLVEKALKIYDDLVAEILRGYQ